MNNTIKPAQLTATECEVIIALHVSKVKPIQIAEQIGRNYQSVSQVIGKFKNLQPVAPLPRSRRPQKLNERDRRHLRNILLNNRHATLQQIIDLFPVKIGKTKM